MSLARKNLASLVCPWTPFLAPRLLRSPLPLVAFNPRSLTPIRSYLPPGRGQWKYRSKNEKKHETKTATLSAEDVHRKELLKESLERAYNATNVPLIEKLYPRIVSSPWWTRDDTRRMVQAIHNYIRSPNTPRERVSSAFSLVPRIIDDIRSGNLAPHPYAHRDLLSLCKGREEYELGVDFWQWLVYQDTSSVDPSVYGAAIELLAYKGDVTLQSLEDLFSQCLKRFPGTFAEYHLSPGAIVPDRSQPFSVVGVPITLLQGILTARIVARDWKNAYLALDTALRLHPSTLPPRFFDLFAQERPISEGYTVFLIACRSGVTPKSRHLQTVLIRLKDSMAKASLEGRMMIVRAMTNAIYAYLQARGQLEGRHISVLMNNGYTGILPQMQPGIEYSEEEESIRSTIVNSAHETASKLIESGFKATDYIFSALISIAGHFNVPELFTVALNDVETSRTDLGPVGHRIALTTAGKLGNPAEVERIWARIATKAMDRGEMLEASDWLTLARACRRADMPHFFLAQVDFMKHAITTQAEASARHELQLKDRSKSFEFAPVDTTIVSEHMNGIQQNMISVASILMSGQPLDLRKSPFSMYCDPTRQPFGGSVENLRTIYDELTTDPHQPAQQTENRETYTSPTGVPLDELRFQNWVSIIDLMRDAEEDGQIWETILDGAIEKSRPPHLMEYELNFERHRTMLKDRGNRDLSLQGLRTYITRLRSPYPNSEAVSSRVLFRRNTQNRKVQVRTFISFPPRHSAPDTRIYRPLLDKSLNNEPSTSEPSYNEPSGDPEEVQSSSQTTLSVSRRRDDELTFKPTEQKKSKKLRDESEEVDKPNLIPRTLYIK